MDDKVRRAEELLEQRKRDRGGNGHTNVADEQEIVHWGFRSLLTAQDWVERYIGAQTAEEAIELVRAHEPHVALIDVMVGDESGAALCERIREICPRTRVMLMSRSGAITG